MSDQIAADIVISDRHVSGRGRMTVLRLSWQPDDPLAVRLLLTATPDHPSLPRGNWVVLRDFLQYGCEEPTGDGRVRISPEKFGERVRLDLMGEGGDYWVTLPSHTLRRFLDATEDVVPTGEERSSDELDALIARLLVEG